MDRPRADSDGTGRRTAVALGLILVVALAVRLVAIAADDGYVPANDAFDYHRHAASIASGDGYPEAIYGPPGGGVTAFRPPAYPFLLAVVYLASGATDAPVGSLAADATEVEAYGEAWTAGRVFDALVGTLIVLLVFLLARRLWRSATIALLAAALTACFPPLVLLSTELLSETVFIALVLGAVLAALRYRDSGLVRWAAGAALLAALATLTRSNGVVLIPLLVLAVWNGRSWRNREALTAAAVVVSVAALTILPWTVRNAVETGRFIPLTTQVGWGMAGTYNQTSLSDPNPAPWRVPAIVEPYAALFRIGGTDEPALHSALREEATDFALSHPLYVGEALLWNTLRTFYLAPAGVYSLDERVDERGVGVSRGWYEPASLWVVLALATVGVAALLRRPPGRRGGLFMWLFPLATLAVAVPLIGLPRYRAPADPFILILAAGGTMALWEGVRAGTFFRSAAGGKSDGSTGLSS